MDNNLEKTQQINILLADDEDSIRELLSIELREIFSDKVAIHEAIDGQIAINLLEKNKFNLCILDINMPIRSGIEVYEFLFSKEKLHDISLRTPIMILSGYLDKLEDNSKKDGSILELKHIISKPFSVKEFSDRVKKILRVD